jgi:hypothetical protein
MKNLIAITFMISTFLSTAQRSMFGSHNIYVAPVTSTPVSSTPGSVVTGGVVIELDAANASSYSGTGTNWYDISGANNHSTIYNSTPFTSALPTYFSFNGSNNYAKSNAALNLGIAANNAMSAEGWVYTSFNGYDFWFTSNVNAGDCTYRFGTDGSGRLYWDMGQHNDRNYAGFSFTNNTWYYVVFTGGLESGTIVTRIYVNGNLITTQNEGITSLPNTNEYFIGTGESGSSHNFSGRIGNVRIFNRVLTAQEVSQNFNATKSRFGL